LVLDPVPAALLAQVLAQQVSGQGIEQADVQVIPLDLHPPPDPAGRRALVSRVHFHAAVQMHGALAVLVIAEGFHGQRQ